MMEDREIANRLRAIDAAAEVVIESLRARSHEAVRFVHGPAESADLSELESVSGVRIPPIYRAILCIHRSWAVDYTYDPALDFGEDGEYELGRYLFQDVRGLRTDGYKNFNGILDGGSVAFYLGSLACKSSPRMGGISDFIYKFMRTYDRNGETSMLTHAPALTPHLAMAKGISRRDPARSPCARLAIGTGDQDALIVDGSLESEPVVWMKRDVIPGREKPRVVAENSLAMMELFVATGMLDIWNAEAYSRDLSDTSVPIWASLPDSVRPPVRRWLDLLSIREELASIYPGIP